MKLLIFVFIITLSGCAHQRHLMKNCQPVVSKDSIDIHNEEQEWVCEKK